MAVCKIHKSISTSNAKCGNIDFNMSLQTDGSDILGTQPTLDCDCFFFLGGGILDLDLIHTVTTYQ